MTDLPIIMSAPMVRALLREVEHPGTGKTMTRRLAWHKSKGRADKVYPWATPWQRVKPGDRLFVREAFSTPFSFKGKPRHLSAGSSIWYWADGIPEWGDWSKPRPSIHLPRLWSRLTLVVSATKIELLQDISDDDCEAEGIESEVWDQAVGYRNYSEANAWFCTWPQGLNDPHTYTSADQIQRRSLQSLWEKLHGPPSWADNPTVVALTFRIHRCNIDALPQGIAA